MSNQNGNKNVDLGKEQGPIVYLSVGAGTKPLEVAWKQGDTVASILKRANIVVDRGKVPTLGKVKVKNPAKAQVQPNDVIVVEGKPGNGVA